MLDCWNMTPSHRPGFKAIREELEARLMQSSNYLYLEQADTGPHVTVTSSDPGSGYWTGEQLGTGDDQYLAPTT